MTSAITRRLFTRKINVFDYIKVTSCSSINLQCPKYFHYTPHITPGVNLLPKFTLYVSRPFSAVGKENEDNKETKLTLFQKFKQMYRDYWYVLVPVHIVTSVAWLGGFYYMAKSGIDIVALLESWHVSPKLVNPLKDSSMGYYAVTYALYKIATPARYTVTLGGTTISINYLKKWGYIKPVPSKEQMKQMYIEKKETISRSMKETKEGIIEKKENLMESLHEKKEGIKETKESIMKTVSDTTKSLQKQKDDIKEKVTNIKDKS